MTVTLFTLALSLLAAPAPKAERPAAGSVPPRVVWIRAARDDKFQLVYTKQVMVSQTVQETVLRDGVARAISRPVTMEVPAPVVRILDVEKVRFYGADGKQIESKEVQKLLTKDMPALLSVDGKPVDRFYLQLAREGTLVLIVPPDVLNPPQEAEQVPVPIRPRGAKPVEKKDAPRPVERKPVEKEDKP